MDALLLVDLQNDFLPGGALGVAGGDEVIPLANALMRRFDRVLASQDWHPAGHASFAASHPGRSIGEQVEVEGLPQMLWPVHCVQGSFGAELAAGLDTDRIERVFQKGTDPRYDSYSAFFDNGHRQATGLGDYLQQQGITSLYVLGIATDYCVKFTALDARRLNLQTTLITDACRAVNRNPQDEDQAIAEMQAAGVHIITSIGLASPGPDG